MKLLALSSTVILGLAVSTPLIAADFSAQILDQNNKPSPSCGEKTAECEQPFTLGRLASAALFTSFPDENDPRSPATMINGDEKAKRAALGLKILGATAPFDLKSDDVVLLRKVIGKYAPPLAVLRAYQLIDPASVPKE